MKPRFTLPALLLTLAGCASTETVGNYEIQRNSISGTVRVKSGDQWIESVREDPLAANAPADVLRNVTFSEVTWGKGGLLCARVKTEKPVKGRVALNFLTRSNESQQWIKDRTLRVYVEWQEGETPFALHTSLPTPDTTRIKTSLSVEPILSTD
jgi:hypothetical protein